MIGNVSDVEKKLTYLEQELKSLKSSQRYGMVQVMSFESDIFSGSGTRYTIPYSSDPYYNVVFDITFSGENENKTLACVVECLEVVGSANWVQWKLDYIPITPSSMRIIIYTSNYHLPPIPFSHPDLTMNYAPGYGHGADTSEYTVSFRVRSNMRGAFVVNSIAGMEGLLVV